MSRLEDFGAVDRTGRTSAVSVINAAINTAYAAGGDVIDLGAGKLLLDGVIVPRSRVRLRGRGPGITTFKVQTGYPVAQAAGTQCVHSELSDISFQAAPSFSNATVLHFTCLQNSVLENLEFIGFGHGVLCEITSVPVRKFDEMAGAFSSSNSIFNRIGGWVCDLCAVGIRLAGEYGPTTPSQDDSSPLPSAVVTRNRYDNIALWGVSFAAFQIIKACDNERFDNFTIELIAQNAAVARLGDDQFTGNNYVNSHWFDGAIAAPVGPVYGFIAGSTNIGTHMVNITHDIAPSVPFTPFVGALTVYGTINGIPVAYLRPVA